MKNNYKHANRIIRKLSFWRAKILKNSTVKYLQINVKQSNDVLKYDRLQSLEFAICLEFSDRQILES